MKITNRTKNKNNAWRYDPDTGFLRCTASILCAGILEYPPDEFPDTPAHIQGMVRMYVSPDQLGNIEAMESLEGMPAVVGHTWQTAGNISACGTIAGAPMISGEHLLADILVTDPEAVRRIMLPDGDPDKLVEISSAGLWNYVWESGVTPDGDAYDGYFVKLSYNHVALLPVGAGRAGATVRIINTKGVAKMEFTRVKFRGKTIRVLNEDVDKMEEIQNEDEEAKKTAVSAEDLQSALDELATLKADRDSKDARIAELEGMIQTYKDQLEEALSPDALENAADELAEERDEATQVMNAAGLKITDDFKKLRGHALRSKVVNSIRVRNGKGELSKEDSDNEGYVKGMYKALAESAGTTSRSKGVTGASAVVVENSSAPVQNMSNNADRFKRLYASK